MASLEQKTELVDKYCSAHREWKQNAEQHQRNYESAMSDHSSANQRINSVQREMDELSGQMSRAENEMRDIESELNSLNNSEERSASEVHSLRSRFEAARNSYDSARNQLMAAQGNLEQAKSEAAQAYMTAQQESQKYEQAQLNVDNFRQSLEQMNSRLVQEAEILQVQVDSDNAYATTLQGAAGIMFNRSALSEAGRLQGSASGKQAELTGTQALIDRIEQEINGGNSAHSIGAKVLRRR